MIDPTLRNINRLFVFSFKNSDNDPKRSSFDKYYIPLVGIKDFNSLIDKKPFFYQPVKNKEELFEKLVAILRSDAYTTVNLLDFSYHQSYYKLIEIVLSRQKNTSTPQKNNFTEKFGKYNGATMFFIAEKQQKTILNFYLDSLKLTE